MTDGDAIVLGILGLALVATPIAICCMWLNVRSWLKAIAAGDPRREF